MAKYKEILKYRSLGFSQRYIADILLTSRNTVQKVYSSADSHNLDWVKASQMSEEEIKELLFPKQQKQSIQQIPDCEYIHKELRKKGVTLTLLWKEYVSECHSVDKYPLQYVQFTNYYRKYCRSNNATMHFNHQPAQRIEVDWAGSTIPIYDGYGNSKHGYLFVGTLPYSQYSYVEVTGNMKQENWINAHVNMFQYFEGSTPMICPDNLKTGVISHPKEGEVILNKAYEELSDYYQTAIIPAAPRTPRGKASVEGTVGKVTTHIIAALRNKRFNSVYEAHKAALIELKIFNDNAFQKRDGSRKTVFENEEKNLLIPLPKEPYEYAEWKVCTVQYNYHIAFEKNHYSVPYEYIKHQVNVRITRRIIEVYYKNKRICSHSRLDKDGNRYSTKTEHMPPNHQKAAKWDGDRFRNWAKKIGPSTYRVTDQLLKSYRVEQQGYKGCRSLLGLSDKYSNEELENACKEALKHLYTPRYKNIKLILENSQSKRMNEIIKNDNEGAILRGAGYYGGNENE